LEEGAELLVGGVFVDQAGVDAGDFAIAVDQDG
jgi:hypothetical protein